MAYRKYNSADEYFEINVDRNGPIPLRCPELGPCWIWKGYINHAGYGRWCHGEEVMAHTRVYERVTGKTVPVNRELDHLCKVTACCNPAHLDPVTHKVNMQRGSLAENASPTCKCGNPMSVSTGGKRYCQACNRVRATAHYEQYGKKKRDKDRADRGQAPIEHLPSRRSEGLCKRGHELDGLHTNGKRYCKTCYRAAYLKHIGK